MVPSVSSTMVDHIFLIGRVIWDREGISSRFPHGSCVSNEARSGEADRCFFGWTFAGIDIDIIVDVYGRIHAFWSLTLAAAIDALMLEIGHTFDFHQLRP